MSKYKNIILAIAGLLTLNGLQAQSRDYIITPTGKIPSFFTSDIKTRFTICDSNVSDELNVIFTQYVVLEHAISEIVSQNRIVSNETIRLSIVKRDDKTTILDYSVWGENKPLSPYQQYLLDMCLATLKYWFTFQYYNKLVEIGNFIPTMKNPIITLGFTIKPASVFDCNCNGLNAQTSDSIIYATDTIPSLLAKENAGKIFMCDSNVKDELIAAYVQGIALEHAISDTVSLNRFSRNETTCLSIVKRGDKTKILDYNYYVSKEEPLPPYQQYLFDVCTATVKYWHSFQPYHELIELLNFDPTAQSFSLAGGFRIKPASAFDCDCTEQKSGE